MAKQYWIGGYFVDVSRNQITYNKTARSIPPKALAVLTYLAEHQGEVVSQDDLLNHVWPDTIVSPNSLQRCIAQLRKAFGDDGKSQDFIKTHAKKGYSLETDIRWEQATSLDQSAAPDLTNTEAPTETSTMVGKSLPIAAIGLLLIIVVWGALTLSRPDADTTSNITISDIRLLTSTDNRELASAYSHDGEYIVFQRYPEVLCTSNLWAKNTRTQEEFQLTKDLGFYGNVSFSKDGQTLAFIEQNDCEAPIQQKACYRLQQLNFADALREPQSPTTLVECNDTEIKDPVWLNTNHIALLQKESNKWQLISYSISTNSNTTLHSVLGGSIVSYDYSLKHNIIGVTSVHADNKLYIEKITPTGELLSSNAIEFPSDIPKYSFVYPNFSLIDDQLIFSTGKQLFTLNFSGDVTKVNLPLTDAIGTPVFHPDGQKMIAIKGHYDSDIAQLALDLFPQNVENLDDHIIVRSTFEENRGKYQRNNNKIAYSSEGDGTSQVWLTETQSNQTRQLSQFPLNTDVRNILWSNDGESLLVNASSQLKRVYLDGKEHDIPLDYPVRNVYHWNESNNTILATIMIEGAYKLVEVNLLNSEFTILTHKDVKWAGYTTSNHLVFMDSLGAFWQSGAIDDVLISNINGQGSNKNAVLYKDVIYSINDDFQLWSYNLNTTEFAMLGQLPDTVDYITDVDDGHVLITYRIAARKDVVELYLE